MPSLQIFNRYAELAPIFSMGDGDVNPSSFVTGGIVVGSDGFWYSVGPQDPTVLPTLNLAVWQSQDQGATWAIVGPTYADSELKPFNGADGLGCFLLGNILWVFYGSSEVLLNFNNTLVAVPFDLSGFTWGIPVVLPIASPPHAGADPLVVGVYRRNSGRLTVIALNQADALNFFSTFAVDFTAGAWGVPTTMFGESYVPSATMQDTATDTVYVFDYDQGGLTGLYMQSIDTGGVFSAFTLVDNGTNLTNFYSIGPGVIPLTVPVVLADGNIGTGSFNGATWTFSGDLDPGFSVAVIPGVGPCTPGMVDLLGTPVLVYLASAGGNTFLRAAAAPFSSFITIYDYALGVPAWTGLLPPYTLNQGFLTLSIIASTVEVYLMTQFPPTPFSDNRHSLFFSLGFGPPTPTTPVVGAQLGGAGAAGGPGGGLGGAPGGFGGFGGGIFGGPSRIKCCTDGHTFQATRMMEAVRQSLKRKEAWPYEYQFPPANSIPVNVITPVPVPSPVVGVLTPVLVYLVPEGFRFILEAILQDFQGAAINPNDALWTVDRDAQLPNMQGAPVNGLAQTPIPLGSIPRGVKWPLPRPYEFAPLTALRSTVVNVNLGVGLPNQFVSGFFGYLLPTLVQG